MNAIDLYNLGTECMQRGDTSAAENYFTMALAQDPQLAEAHANLAWLLETLQRATDAEHHYREAMALQPDALPIALNLAALLRTTQRLTEAHALYRTTLARHPDAPEVWSSLGVAEADLGHDARAAQCFRTALTLAPDFRAARYNLACLLLGQQRWEQGWHHFEARQTPAALAEHFQFPRWEGEDLSGKWLLIGVEGGYGDLLQFCRYASLLKARGAARVTLLCHPPLKRLLQTLHGVDEVLDWNDAIPRRGPDYWTLPMSLPRLCQPDPTPLAAAIPYLSADATALQHWQQRLPGGKPRIGIAWQGNPLHANDANRSLPTADYLAPLALAGTFQFVNLQKPADNETTVFPFTDGVDPMPEVEDFADTAAVLATLDLVICVDSAIAHLAGALGIPCWVMLPAIQPDWRWPSGQDTTPWYPGTHRLFRQRSPGDWHEVVQALCRELMTLDTERSPQ